MSVAVTAGQRISWTIVGSTGSWIPRTPDTVRSSAIATLSQYMTVNSLSVVKVSGGFFSQYPLVFGYEAQLVGTALYGHRDIEDLNAVVRSAFWGAAGEQATVSAPGISGQVTQLPGTDDQSPDPTNKFLTAGAITIVAAVGVAVFVLKRG